MQPHEEVTMRQTFYRVPPLDWADPAVDLPQPQWSTESLDPVEFVQQHQGNPAVARLIREGGARPADLGPLVDLERPVLVYSQRRRTKVYAQNLWWDYGKSRHSSEGPLLEIPKDYSGWFEVVPQDNRPSSHYTSVEEVANTGCRLFLVRTTVVGFLTEEDQNGELNILQEVKVYPGEVLKVQKVCKKKWKTKVTKSKSGHAHQNTTGPETRMLKCKNWKKEELCLPLAHPGKFSIIANKDCKDPKVVYQVKDVIRNFSLPQTVRLVFGSKPKGPCKFGGIFRLLEFHRPDTLVLYSFTPNRHVIVELPFETNVKLQVATNMETIEASTAYKTASDTCKSLVYAYVIGMKPLEFSYDAQEVKALPQEKGVHRGHLAAPCDMCTFNPMDIFPPLDEEEARVSDSWTLSFKDPETLSGGIKSINLGMHSGESEDSDPRQDTLNRQSGPEFNRSNSHSSFNGTDPSVIRVPSASAHDLALRNGDVRKSRVEEHWKRASRC